MDVVWKVAVAIILPNVGGIIGALFTVKSLHSWFENLELPSYRPPNWIFAPVWILQYSCMGFASYLVWRDGAGFSGDAKWPLIVYGCQLILNWAWTPIFFGLQSMKGGLIDIVILLVTVFVCGILFWRVNHTAGYLLIPYILWLSFAAVLNYDIYKSNS